MSQMVSRVAKNAAALANTVIDLLPSQTVEEDATEVAAEADEELPARRRRKLQEPTNAGGDACRAHLTCLRGRKA